MARGEGGGAPLGNKNAERGHEAKRALKLALEHYPNMPPVIERMQKLIVELWHPIIRKALEDGDLQALREIHDRIDGKAPQAVYLAGGEDGEPIKFQNVDELTDEQLAAIASGRS